jgi:hypothetical protein
LIIMRTLAIALVLGLCGATASAAPRVAKKPPRHAARVATTKPAKAKVKRTSSSPSTVGAKHATNDRQLMQPKWL